MSFYIYSIYEVKCLLTVNRHFNWI